MGLVETLPAGPGTAGWSLWSTTARLVVTDPAALDAAGSLVRAELAAVERACSRFRADSELSLLRPAAGRPVEVSPLLAELVGAALAAAARTGGDVDPTVGGPLADLGYDRDIDVVPAEVPCRLVVSPAPGWRHVRLEGRRLTVPPGVRLDLGATAKAVAADRCARLVAGSCGVGVLVSLGGDIATAGPGPAGGWQVLVRDRPGEPATTVRIADGTALATSSTLGRRWTAGGRSLHHILDPRTCLPARPVWRTVSVGAPDCLAANTLSTAAVIRGERAVPWLRSLGVPARLVAADRSVVTLGGWPS